MRAPETDWREQLLIDGRRLAGAGEPLPVFDPATEEVLRAPATASPEQCDEAIAAARTAFERGDWAADAARRARLLGDVADLIEANLEELTAAVVAEVGTPIGSARDLQVARAARVFRWFGEAALRDRTEEIGEAGDAIRSRSRIQYLPSGVVAAITAYNYPLLLPAFKLGAALAAGCTSVLLPSPQAPLCALLLTDLFERADCPPGVLNVILGEAAIGERLCTLPDVDCVSFTGSIPIGATVMRQAAAGLKTVVLELGGKSPAILLPSADVARAAKPVHLRYLRNAGQGCQSPTRVLVHRPRLDEFVEHSREVFDTVVTGDPWDEATLVGPVISSAHRERVEGFVAEALAAGGEVLAGDARRPPGPGWYVSPALVGGVDNGDRIAREEIFGPIGVLLPYDEVEEAVAIANDSEYGLAAAVYGDEDEAVALAGRLRVGAVTVNGGGEMRPDAPMGGFKLSGVGREMGEDGVREFLEPQHVQWRLRQD